MERLIADPKLQPPTEGKRPIHPTIHRTSTLRQKAIWVHRAATAVTCCLLRLSGPEALLMAKHRRRKVRLDVVWIHYHHQRT